MRRDKVIRLGAIVIVLALLLSLLAGAFSVAPAQAATVADSAKFVQNQKPAILAAGTEFDTDGDGIVNNQDPDIDGDGVVNINDNDIDGDGTTNFEDGDPAETNGFDGKTPKQPGGVTFQELTENGSAGWLVFGAAVVIVALLIFGRKFKQNKANKPQKNL